MTWVALKDRKPAQGQLCLIVAPSDETKLPMRHMAFWSDQKGFYTVLPYYGGRVTHWMPYPELPEELK